MQMIGSHLYDGKTKSSQDLVDFGFIRQIYNIDDLSIHLCFTACDWKHPKPFADSQDQIPIRCFSEDEPVEIPLSSLTK
jgi:hypothetical protein